MSAALDVTVHPSPNCGPRRGGLRPRLIILHYTAMTSAQAALERLCDPSAEVSAHYLISGRGEIIQMVEEDQRAWHAGQGEWAGLDDINSRSIGIELDNRGDHPFSEPQMQALEALLPEIMARHDIAPEGVIGHSCLAPGRKVDPGPRFDWARLARRGRAQPAGTGPLPVSVTAETFRAAAQVVGFTAPCDDDTLLSAVRMRFRPWGCGPLTPADLAALPAPIDAPRGGV
ncbi:N-acetylmuramoyl-L-alanine amidase AmiD [Sulfitobacter indolifex]|uniref:N-acetylmuramoyl-L-alanine amidase n=1 Tax=Sulfitobacter indolifex HEL-45 TaxID=391624 RepID=A0ABM9X6F9_9RHOB|nr:N-acetylmuramoyl-L-alanine amidase [Sulfitobacter indolifex]EDQ05084.1 N-acetylmuramoyl-L-alanine amidase, putative [Sulfitobacter indolifex HEL-45]UOA18132.1 N-acetylmuramoyl-L-alanine amidase AmiD [Sulfitobacter indolifex]